MESTIYCAVRKDFVADQPEERVRQALITKMTGELGFPKSTIGVEKALSQMPHITSVDVPLRRADIVCFAKGIHPEYDLYPLLLIECKAVPLNAKVLQQVAGYNLYMKAPFVCVANLSEVKTGWLDRKSGNYQYIDTLPSYEKLLKAVVASGNA